MNIFVLDTNVRLAARYHNDKHVVKMILESAQMLCTVYHAFGFDGDIPYKKAHINHPCTVWARTSIENFMWLLSLANELLTEYTYRYGRIHASTRVIDWCEENFTSIENKFTIRELTPFAQAMPDKYKMPNGNAVAAYRKYYVAEKNELAKWKMRDVPPWYSEMRNIFLMNK